MPSYINYYKENCAQEDRESTGISIPGISVHTKQQTNVRDTEKILFQGSQYGIMRLY